MVRSNGDSGGPLFHYGDDGEPILVGVVSSSVECGDSTFPGLYVRTSAHVDFIEGNYKASQNNLTLIITASISAGIVAIAIIGVLAWFWKK